MCGIEDEVGEEDWVAPFIDQEAACRVMSELAENGRGSLSYVSRDIHIFGGEMGFQD